jgi:hypothetical protein
VACARKQVYAAEATEFSWRNVHPLTIVALSCSGRWSVQNSRNESFGGRTEIHAVWRNHQVSVRGTTVCVARCEVSVTVTLETCVRNPLRVCKREHVIDRARRQFLVIRIPFFLLCCPRNWHTSGVPYSRTCARPIRGRRV